MGVLRDLFTALSGQDAGADADDWDATCVWKGGHLDTVILPRRGLRALGPALAAGHARIAGIRLSDAGPMPEPSCGGPDAPCPECGSTSAGGDPIWLLGSEESWDWRNPAEIPAAAVDRQRVIAHGAALPPPLFAQLAGGTARLCCGVPGVVYAGGEAAVQAAYADLRAACLRWAGLEAAKLLAGVWAAGLNPNPNVALPALPDDAARLDEPPAAAALWLNALVREAAVGRGTRAGG